MLHGRRAPRMEVEMISDAERKGGRIVFHFAGVHDTVTVFGDEWACESYKKTDIAKWQIFWADGRIKHIVNMDNVTFIEVVDE